jgi:hypothetical protein
MLDLVSFPSTDWNQFQEYRRCLTSMQDVIKHNPMRWNVWNDMGYLLLHMADYQESLAPVALAREPLELVWARALLPRSISSGAWVAP